MCERAERLAERFKAVNREVIRAVGRASGRAWTQPCRCRHGTLGSVAYHVAETYPVHLSLIETVVRGDPLPRLDAPLPRADNGACSAPDRDAAPPPPSATVVTTLLHEGARAAAMVRGLGYDDLDRSVVVPALGDAPRSVEDLIEDLLIGHPQEHLQCLRFKEEVPFPRW